MYCRLCHSLIFLILFGHSVLPTFVFSDPFCHQRENLFSALDSQVVGKVCAVGPLKNLRAQRKQDEEL